MVKTELDSLPAELDDLNHKITQLQIEQASLQKETDEMSKQRLAHCAGFIHQVDGFIRQETVGNKMCIRDSTMRGSPSWASRASTSDKETAVGRA